MDRLAEAVALVVREGSFSGVVRVDEGGETLLAEAYGLADRAHGIPMSVDSQLAVASGSKAMTALAVMSLIDEGLLALSTPARSVLGDDLPLVSQEVTLEHLLSHRSGIGDYLDEDVFTDVDDYVLALPVHRLATSEDFLALLDNLPAKFPAGERFSYCNSGYIILALIAERVSGLDYHTLVQQRICRPAGMRDSAYLRSDKLPGRAAIGYVRADADWRTNVLHLPVRGNGDGGLYSTASDVHRFWTALFDGAIVRPATVAEMVRTRGPASSNASRYGLGFWLYEDRNAVELEGHDAGVSFRSHHEPSTALTWTVLSNTSYGAWPLATAIDHHFAPPPR